MPRLCARSLVVMADSVLPYPDAGVGIVSEPAAQALKDGMVAVGGGLVAMAEALKGGVCVDVDVQLHFPPVKETVVFMATIVTTAAVVYGVVSRVLFKK
ncbi:unnamed protein product (mitochondrion) [Plasmodiophora brassicae]|uniref:Uncharacterized protein n=1 Tax=Plasmodiophora brassicae TaxID=37360 RepID=A0A0G4IXH8_PLABS|nr:hypothetical protein PBRA_007686 [Plasmodiophora brassicae]SPQ99582.1 unnamed protein product [Plasmodiophora brassicae]